MKIRITYPDKSTRVFYRVIDACLDLLTRYRHTTKKPMGGFTIQHLMEYTDLVTIEKIDHSVHWTTTLKTPKKEE